ncbi:MAG: response regulator [Myxococcales bacterium]|nr:response regulator [Myxococcales bacterium]
MRTEKKHCRAANWRNPRVLTPGLLALGVIIFAGPLILARDAPWVVAWVDCALLLAVIATTLKCFATSRRLHGQQRTTWYFISSAFLSLAISEAMWLTYELILNVRMPIPSPADIGYLSAPILLAVGIWLYRTNSPTFPEVIVQLGNTGILVAVIYLANMIIIQQRVPPSFSPEHLRVLLMYSVIAPTASMLALFNICFYMRGRRRMVMMPLLLALISLALTNYFTEYYFIAGVYDSASYENIGFILVFAFGSWAAFEQDHLRQSPDADHDPRTLDEAARKWETLLPPLALAGLMAVALTHLEDLTIDLIPPTVGALFLFIAAIALRDWWSQRIEAQLREGTRRGAASLQESEQRLLAMNEELAASNRELSKEIVARKHIQDELRHSQKMEAIGQLTGGVAHDFNNLLAVIVGNVDLLEQTLEFDSSQRIYTQEAKAAANRGAALTKRLLAFSRKQALDPRPIAIRDLLNSMTTLLESTLGEKIQLRFEVSADIATFIADPAQLENAILNLVINARDAMRAGGLITIEASNVTLDARDVEKYPEAEAGGYVSIAVRDTGEGMSAQVLERVFEPFFTTKEMGAGSGLGLSMVYGFVKQSGGHISIDSKEGSGTEVRFDLPQTDLLPDPIDDIHINAAPTGQRESVLVVEDDPALRNVIVSFLEQQNYQVASAPESSEALAILDTSGPFDLLLSDIILPGELSGPELANEIANRQPSIKIVLMSGYASDALEGKASPPKYAKLLQKPFSMGTLAKEMRSVLKAEEGASSGSD